MSIRSTHRKLLDARYQNHLAERLRTMREDRALTIVKRIICRDQQVGLKIANRIIRRPEFLEQIFRDGLAVANESTARFWVDALAPRLGASRLIDLVRERASTDPVAARRFLYWLPSVVNGDAAAKPHLDQLRNDLTQRTAG